MAAASRRSPRHQRRLERADPAGDPDDVGMRAQLEVHHRADAAREGHHIRILDVPPVLAQMHRDAVGAAALGGRGSLHRVRFVRLARFAQGRDVIDVDVEAHEVLG